MHDGCTAAFQNGKQVVDKIRMMGFNASPLARAFNIECSQCGHPFIMAKMEGMCPKCRMVYGVTPCHSHSPEFVQAAGVDY